MIRSKRMRQIADIADAQVRDATRAMTASRQALGQCEAQLEELRRYRAEYREKSAAVPGDGDPRRLNDYRLFLVRLDEAIRHQERLVTQARIDLDHKTAEWRGVQTHAKALNKVVQRFRAEETRKQACREQKEQDEIRPVIRLTRGD